MVVLIQTWNLVEFDSINREEVFEYLGRDVQNWTHACTYRMFPDIHRILVLRYLSP